MPARHHRHRRNRLRIRTRTAGPAGTASDRRATSITCRVALGFKGARIRSVLDIVDDSESWSGVRAYAVDPEQAARLWRLSAELTGVDAFDTAT